LGDILVLSSIDKIKKLVIIALVSDDYLMEQLVLKGGNAIDLVYQISGRASVDLDYSVIIYLTTVTDVVE